MQPEDMYATARFVLVGLIALATAAAASCSGTVPTPTVLPSPAPESRTPTPTVTRAPVPEQPPATPIPQATATAVRRPSPVPTLPPTATPLAVPSPVTTPPPTPDTRRRGGVLNLASRANIAHQDVHLDASPALSTWGPGIAYSRLLRFRSGPGVELPSLAVECDLCESWEMESPTSFLFHLRDDARWQAIAPVNGRSVVADDVVYSYLRQGQRTLPNSPLLQNLGEVTALGPWELRVTARSQDADFLTALADGHSKIVAREAVEASGDLRDGPTIGTGPWVLERTENDDAHLFTRNPDYFEPGLPLLDGLRIHILPDETTRKAAFMVGVVDVDQLGPQTWTEYSRQNPDASPVLIKEPGTGLEVALKADRPPFDDLRVRQAAFLSMDPYKAIEEHWGGFAFVSLGFQAYEADWLLPEDETRLLFRRPSDARELLRDAGITEPIPVTIKVGDFGEPFLAHAHSISIEMRTVGFDPEVQIVNRREFGEAVWLGGDYQMFVGPPAPISSPNGYLLSVLHSNGIWNTTGHRDPQLDALLEAQAVSLDPAERADLIRRIQERVLEQAYRFMPAARVAIWVTQPRVRGFLPNFAGDEYYHWARVWLDPS